METRNNSLITVETIVNVPVEIVWKYWTQPQHIIKWNNASDDWHTPLCENDLRAGGKFFSRMEAKDGSSGFDFIGIYDEVKLNQAISYTLGDERKVTIKFISQENKTKIIEMFGVENTYPVEAQQKGWQSILDNFKKYSEQAINN